MGESLEGLRLGIWHPQWKNSRDFVSNNMEVEDEHPRLSSDLHMYAMAWHTCTDICIFKCPHHTCACANKIMC